MDESPPKSRKPRAKPPAADSSNSKQEGGDEGQNGGESRAPAHSTAGMVSKAAAPLATPSTAAQGIMEALARRFDPDDLCARLQEGLDAMTPAIVAKDGKIITRPDYSTRLRYMELVMAYLVGRPIERQMTINATQPATLEDLLEKARKSPVFRATLQDILRGLETAEQGAG